MQDKAIATIEQVRLHLCKIRTSGFNYSRWQNHENYSLLYEVHAAGKIGWGESTCKYGTLGMARRLAKSLIGKNPELREKLLDPCLFQQSLAYQWLIGIDRRRRQIREGFSIALNDLVAKIRDQTIYQLLGRMPTRDRVALMPVIHVNDVVTMVACAKAWADDGFSFLKIKLSGNSEHDIRAVKEIKAACPQVAIFVVDANHGYKDFYSAAAATIEFRKLGASYIQNPFRGRISQYRKLHEITGMKLTADSMAYWPKVRAVLNAHAAQLVNLHPNLMGGIDNLFRVIDFAKSRAVPTIIGSSGWMGIQDRAYQKAAFLTDAEFPSEDFGLNPYFQGARAKYYSCQGGVPEVLATGPDIRSGIMYDRPDEIGFGIAVDRSKIEPFLDKEWVFK